ncbi:MAG: hypothetical protein ACK59A_08905 [Cyanobacteriota bacterium]
MSDSIPSPPSDAESTADFSQIIRPWPGLDRPGFLQALGGTAVGLIALFTSYDHLTILGRKLPIAQSWGMLFIAASVALVAVDAQLATRARDRAANEADRARDRAAEDRERQAREAQRQRRSLGRLHQSAVLSARVQLDPSATNRALLRAFLALMAEWLVEEGEG